MIDLSQVSDEDLGREWIRRLNLKRQYTNKRGRNKVLRPCPFCREQLGALELRRHKPHCDCNPHIRSQYQ